jgi:hypothetical protein
VLRMVVACCHRLEVLLTHRQPSGECVLDASSVASIALHYPCITLKEELDDEPCRAVLSRLALVLTHGWCVRI